MGTTAREALTGPRAAQVLTLVRQALNDFEVIPLSGSVRRAIRIANLLGDPETAIRLSLEIRSQGGNKFAQTENLMQHLLEVQGADATDSAAAPAGPAGPAGRALEEYIKDRSPSTADMVWCHTISELEELASKPSLEDDVPAAILEWRFISRQIVERARNQTFALLCRWERELHHAGTPEAAHAGRSQQVESLLRDAAARELHPQ